MKANNLILNDWWQSRYDPEGKKLLDKFACIDNVGDKVKILSEFILEKLSDPILLDSDSRFPVYKISEELLENNNRIREIFLKDLKSLIADGCSWEQLEEFVNSNHENIKRSQNRWFAANPGLLLEFIRIDSGHSKRIIDWLAEMGVSVGDDVIHLHVISNKGRKRLKDLGFEVKYEHWDKQYYLDMLLKTSEMLEMNKNIKGLFCDSSWIFNPKNFEVAPDNKSFVSFDYLKNEELTGEKIDIGDCLSHKDFETQVNFSMRSERRKKFVEEGIFNVKVYATFYGRDKLIEKSSYFKTEFENTN